MMHLNIPSACPMKEVEQIRDVRDGLRLSTLARAEICHMLNLLEPYCANAATAYQTDDDKYGVLQFVSSTDQYRSALYCGVHTKSALLLLKCLLCS